MSDFNLRECLFKGYSSLSKTNLNIVYLLRSCETRGSYTVVLNVQTGCQSTRDGQLLKAPTCLSPLFWITIGCWLTASSIIMKMSSSFSPQI